MGVPKWMPSVTNYLLGIPDTLDDFARIITINGTFPSRYIIRFADDMDGADKELQELTRRLENKVMTLT